MDKKHIKEFFDRCAPSWNIGIERPEAVIQKIMDNAQIAQGEDVLDVACGTGVLFPYYQARALASLTAIDISPEMVKIARASAPEVNVLCGDAETAEFDKTFDAIVIYNAFPHFPDSEGLIRALSKWLKPNGRLTVAHGMSRERLAKHHAHCMDISIELPTAETLAALFEKYLDVSVVISDDSMYQVVGVKR